MVIPRYVTSPVANAVPPTRAVMPAPAKPMAVRSAASSPVGNPGVHVVARGETLSKISRLYGKSLTDLAKANNIQPSAKLSVGDRLVIPGVRTAQAAPKPGAAIAQAKPAPAPQKVAAVRPEPTPGVKQQGKVQQVEPPANARVLTPAADPVPETPTGATGSQSTAAPSFRWPVRGRVITGFGPKTSGGQNDGINVAVPEGTPIKAAEDGVVAYAGNELKGYGNLVLVRHSNGFVTAYAHASELSVKKGETIKRGQVIGKAGATGNVTSPQLHFEVRKGATPVDPTQYLNGG